ncbi:hypothetical protein LguiB_019223 [Lonicera macranthoides]
MSPATLFLSPPPLSNPHHLSSSSDSFIPLSSLSLIPPISLKNPKPIHSSKPHTANTTTTLHDKNNQSTKNPDFYPFKAPTAPWMRGPTITLVEPNQVLNNKQPSSNQSLTERVSGGRGKRTMKKVVQGIEKLLENHNLNSFDPSNKPIEFDFPLEEFGKEGNLKFGGKLPWERDERVVFRRTKKEKVMTAAELSLDGDLLERLRGEAAKMRKWVKVKKAGVTQAVVDQIHFIWKNNELAMLKFDLPLCRNMDRAREIVEVKTGGLVVWSKKDELVIHRGCNYKLGSKCFSKKRSDSDAGKETLVPNATYQENLSISKVESSGSALDEMLSRKEETTVAINGSLFEREADRLLDGLGPRFIDWWRHKPLPVDADLLSEVVPGFKTSFRLCPPHAKSNKLTDEELTHLRNLAQPLPTHFVLGRNRKLQGLAAAILKLWEKCHIAKIAVKLGIPNTDNEQMANELKAKALLVQLLTGGVLLLRNKFYIILYRGKDFLPCDVANLVAERETELSMCQLEEESARYKTVETFYLAEPLVSTSTSGTLSEFQGIQSEREGLKNGNREAEVKMEVEKYRLEREIKKQENKLFILKKKIKRTGRELAKLNSSWRPKEHDGDRELITHEERECFQKIGLKMDRFLVLGRRGIFDGVIEGLHQHWKHKEIVKVITMQRVFSRIMHTAKLLEAESGGILVSVDKLKKGGHAIILYRGKNYRRPLKLVPENLLNKQDALRRSLDMQRIGVRAISALAADLLMFQ